jgi:tRNA (adenine22-N1)-methyltransferase
MIRLQGRLLQAASMLEGCERPADIGTDHAYIPIYLVQSGKCDRVIATDVRKGPLQKAAINIEKHQLSPKIELRLGDGIKPIREGECDSFILAGMGGVVISGILKASPEVVKKAKALVLQPVYTEACLREFLFRQGFRIDDEVLVRDEGRIYVVIRAAYDGIQRYCEDLYYHIGRALFERKDPLLKAYLERRIRIQAGIAHGMAKSGRKSPDDIQKEMKLLERMKEAYAEMRQ